MKNLLIATLVYTGAISLAEAQECMETQSTVTQDVVYEVNKNMPAHLKGAVIIVRQADGRETSVPAERFMVVKRIQYTKLGENKITNSKLTCKAKQKKNIVFVDAKKEHSGLNTTTQLIPGGVSAKVQSDKALTPGLNYYRRQLLDSDLGAGVGIDKNGQIKGMIGLDW
jgi:hypothetical protein